MKISDAGIDLIKQWEGLRLDAYQDTGGVWTIGYGHTKGVKEGQIISAGQALTFLREDLDWAEDAINDLISVPLEQHQFDALVSWAYNVGRSEVAKSTLRRRLNAGAYDDVPAQLMRWVYDDGVTIDGLINRRRAECAHWRGLHLGSGKQEGRPSRPSAPPLKPIADSKTMKGGLLALIGQIITVTGTVMAAIFGALGGLPVVVQVLIVLGLFVGLPGAGYVLVNRFMERKRGER